MESWWLGAPILCNALALLPWLRLLFLPQGSVYSAPGPLVVCGFIAFGSLLICLSTAAYLCKSRRLGRALFCFVFGLTPMLVGLAAGYGIASWKGISVPYFEGAFK